MAKAFERIFIIFLEQKSEPAVVGNAFMKDLASPGISLTKYFGLTHPSQPNYIADARLLDIGSAWAYKAN